MIVIPVNGGSSDISGFPPACPTPMPRKASPPRSRRSRSWPGRGGLRYVDWYVDGEPGSEDIGDEDGPFRPALRRLLASAESPDFNFGTVLVWALSRLSRNQAHFILVHRVLQDAGVDVRSVTE